MIEAIRAEAHRLGFDAVGITQAELGPEAAAQLGRFLQDGRHGQMRWMEDRADQRSAPRALWAEAKSVICVGLSYAPAGNALATIPLRSRGNISVYARHRDYHTVLKGKLKHLAQWLVSRQGGEIKVFVDTAPVMEKKLAERAGIGWQGKHTNLVSRTHGSWLFLGEIYTSLDLPSSEMHADRCGTCRRCQDVCPTNAFPAPYRLDATRCISYLTIEHAGPVAADLREGLGNRIYGCDDCLAVCPWNRFAAAAREQKLQPRDDLVAPSLAELAQLDDAAFRARFAGTPIKRIGRNRFVRNVLYAIGNSAEPMLAATAACLCGDADSAVADAARWALDRLASCASS